MNVFIFAKHIWNRDRAIYDQAPKTVQKYFDLHTQIYNSTQLNWDDYVKKMVNCIVSRISNRKNASKLSKDESALRRCEEHLCDSSFGVYTYSMPCDSWKFKLIWGLYNNSIKSNSLIAGQNTPPKKFGFLSKGRLNPPPKLKKIFFLLGATRA